MKFSKSKQGFYPVDMLATYAAAGTLPDDLVDIAPEAHAALMAAQSAGKVIDWTGAAPVAANRPAPTLAEAKAAKLAAMNAQCGKVADALTAGYPDFEISTWPDQQREVLAWQADAAAPTPCLDALAGFRGIPRLDYIAKTLTKVQQFRAAGWYLAGTRQKYEDQIKAATSTDALTVMTFNFTLG
jgi:hypothetical protein